MLRLVPDALSAPQPTADAEDASRVRRRDPGDDVDPRRRIDAAIAMLQIGEHHQAIHHLAPLAARPDAIGGEALWLTAHAHTAQGRAREAITCLELALLETRVSELGRIALLYDLGVVSESIGDHRRARESFDAVRRRAPWFRDAAARAYALGA